MAVVVDTSALAALVFAEVGFESVARQLEGQVMHAPTLIDYELASVALKKLRRVPANAAAVVAALETARQIPLARIQPDMVQVVALAVATNLTPYDASYLWVARTLGLKLVTLDRALAEAARRL
jgi:predicted nucleic acid-binding protein